MATQWDFRGKTSGRTREGTNRPADSGPFGYDSGAYANYSTDEGYTGGIDYSYGDSYQHPDDYKNALEALAPQHGPNYSTSYQLRNLDKGMGIEQGNVAQSIWGAGEMAKGQIAGGSGLSAEQQKAADRQVGRTQSKSSQQIAGAGLGIREALMAQGEQQKLAINQGLYDEGIKAWSAKSLSDRIRKDAEDDGGTDYWPFW